MKKRILTLLAAACMASCIYPFDPELPAETEKTVVVDGRILVGGISTIRLGYLTPINSDNLLAWPNGKAWIEDDLGNTYPATESGGSLFNIPGTQFLNASSQPSTFRAVVEVDGQTYTSDWLTPDPAPSIDDIHFNADDSNVYVSVDLNPGLNNTGYIGFLFEETWEFHSDIYPDYYIDPQTWAYGSYAESQFVYPYYWCWKTFSPAQVTLFDYTSLNDGLIKGLPVRSFLRTDGRNHKRYSILVKAFALSKEAFDYNRQTQEISDLGGDLFSPDPGALIGNLSCESDPELPVMGLVLAGRVAQKRVFEDTYKFFLSRPPSINYEQVAPADYQWFYFTNNYRPATMVNFESGSDIGWVPHRCINCIEAGGTQVRPSYWED